MQWRSILRFDEAPNQSYVTGGTLEDAFWRTLILDAVVDLTSGGNKYVPATPEDGNAFKIWWSMLCGAKNDLPAMVDDPAFRRVHNAMPSATSNRRFFTTKKEFIGNGPPGVQFGDEVYVLHGCNSPFILRKNSRKVIIPSDPAQQPLHTLVGDCYLHGIMDGEAIKHFGGTTTQVNLI